MPHERRRDRASCTKNGFPRASACSECSCAYAGKRSIVEGASALHDRARMLDIQRANSGKLSKPLDLALHFHPAPGKHARKGFGVVCIRHVVVRVVSRYHHKRAQYRAPHSGGNHLVHRILKRGRALNRADEMAKRAFEGKGVAHRA